MKQCHLVIAAILAFLPAELPEASAEECSDALSTVVAAALQPTLQQQDVCRGLRRDINGPFNSRLTLAIDKTDKIEIRRLRYCPSEQFSRLEASVYVRCKTSDAAVVRMSLDEEFDFKLTVRNENCEIEAFDVTPRGDIGRLVAQIVGLSDRMRAAAASNIRTLCK